jgi:hypothetical protein
MLEKEGTEKTNEKEKRKEIYRLFDKKRLNP